MIDFLGLSSPYGHHTFIFPILLGKRNTEADSNCKLLILLVKIINRTNCVNILWSA